MRAGDSYASYDTDGLLLLAVTLSAKRRPAELTEIIAAADLLQGFVPFEARLRDAFSRLARQGLIAEIDGRFELTPAAQAIMAGQPKKADTAARVLWIGEKISAHVPKEEHAAINLTTEQVVAAIQAHRASARGVGKNLLMPKPKTAEGGDKRAGQWNHRRPAPVRRKA